jgi:FKBP-type peptidyl-prolyl cis-trans isomerase FkpA
VVRDFGLVAKSAEQATVLVLVCWAVELWSKSRMATTDLQIEKLTSGNGATPQKGQTVSVHYTGRFTDGRKFDSSVDRSEPFNFVLGEGQVIAGWDMGVAKMKVGDKVRLTIPPELAYGRDGYPGAIPPNSTLVFEVELLGIEPKPAAADAKPGAADVKPVEVKKPAK